MKAKLNCLFITLALLSAFNLQLSTTHAGASGGVFVNTSRGELNRRDAENEDLKQRLTVLEKILLNKK
jgi:hypothetical protein